MVCVCVLLSMILLIPFYYLAQTVKSLSALWESQVQYLGQEDPLEKEMATHSSILAWKITLTEDPGELQSMGSQRFRHDWATNTCMLFFWHHLQPQRKLPLLTSVVTPTASHIVHTMNCMFVSPQSSYIETYSPGMMVCGGRIFGRWLGHEDGILSSGISTL